MEGLIERLIGESGPAEAKVREGVALAGGGVVGWFRAGLEADLMKGNDAGWLRRELVRERQAPPTVEAVLAVASIAAEAATGDNRNVVVAWVRQIRPWLQQAAALDWKPDDFEAVAEMLCRFELYDLLGDFAQTVCERDPTSPAGRFHAIVASNKGDPDKLKPAERREIEELADRALDRHDLTMVKRISRFMDGELGLDPNVSRRRPVEASEELDPGDFINMLRELLDEMPKSASAELRKRVRDQGRERALSKLMDEMADSSMGPGMPKSILRMLCEVMLAEAMREGAKDSGGDRRRSYF
jgi:hypothetical protein